MRVTSASKQSPGMGIYNVLVWGTKCKGTIRVTLRKAHMYDRLGK